MCICIHTCIYMYVYIHVHVYMYTYMYIAYLHMTVMVLLPVLRCTLLRSSNIVNIPVGLLGQECSVQSV